MAVPLAVLSIASTALGSFASATAARKGAEEDTRAAGRNAAASMLELTRQQSEVQKAARARKGDRAMEADRERATLMALSAERGALGSTLVDRLVGQAAHFENEDIGRIEANTTATVAALQADKEAVSQDALNVAAVSRRRARTARTGAFFGAVGSGLQIASRAYGQNQIERDARR